MLSRTPPPPLQLLHDNTVLESVRPSVPRPFPRPAPPRAQWRIAKLFKRLYRSDWRTVVIAVAFLNALRFFFSATNALEHVTPATRRHFPRLASVSTALSTIYVIAALIQAFGVVSAFTRRLLLIRLYTYLSLLSALLIVAAGFVRELSYFFLEEDLVTECIALSVVGSHQTRGLFHSKPVKNSIPHPLRHSALPSFTTAFNQCFKAYTNPLTPAPLVPVSLLLFSVLPAALFFLLAYTYHRQTTDPAHPACLLHVSTSSATTSTAHCLHTASLGMGRPANTTKGKRGQAQERVKLKPKAKGKGKAPGRPQPDALPLPHEQHTLLGNTSASTSTSLNTHSVDITSAPPAKKYQRDLLAQRDAASTGHSLSPYNLTPGPPSFGGSRMRGGQTGGGTDGAPGTGIAGPSRTRGRGSVWFSRAMNSGGSEGLGYSYADAYGGRLI